MKLFFYCKRQLQMDMTYTWSQITITSWLFKNVCSVFYMLVVHFFQTFEIFRFISSGAFWNNFWKFFKNHTQLLGTFLRATITASFSDFALSWRHWFTGGYSPYAAKTVSHTVLALKLLPLPKYLSHVGNPISSWKLTRRFFGYLSLFTIRKC